MWFADTRKFHGSILLKATHHVFQAASQLFHYLIGCPVWHITVKFRHGTHGSRQFFDDGRGPISLKYATSHNAIGIDELSTEFVIFEQVKEQTDHFDAFMVIKYTGK